MSETLRVITLSEPEFVLLKRIMEYFLGSNDPSLPDGDYDLLWHAIVIDSEEKRD
jgi:hypothetical protein